MQNLKSQFSTLKDNLETVAFLITKGNSEKEAHSKVVQSLVLLTQIESKISDLLTSKGYEQVSVLETRSQPWLSRKKTNIPFSKANGDEIAGEIHKVKRKVPRWFKNSSQYNSIILYNFLELSEQQNQVTTKMLRNKCQVISDFDGNYNQMKNFGEKNHGKVFEETNGIITLWEPVKEFILDLYKQYKG